jgi:predicted acyltransferase
LTFIRFTQNSTLSAHSVSPLDHFHGLTLTVTVSPSSLHTGGSPMLFASSTSGVPSLPK